MDEETGYYYFGARYYDPNISVWLSTDPILGKYLPTKKMTNRVLNYNRKKKSKVLLPFDNNVDYHSLKLVPEFELVNGGGVYRSINLNLYNYVLFNPMFGVDPDGRSVESKALIVGGFILKGLSYVGHALNIYENVATAGAGFADDPAVIPALVAMDLTGSGMIVTGAIMEISESLDSLITEMSRGKDLPGSRGEAQQELDRIKQELDDLGDAVSSKTRKALQQKIKTLEKVLGRRNTQKQRTNKAPKD